MGDQIFISERWIYWGEKTTFYASNYMRRKNIVFSVPCLIILHWGNISKKPITTNLKSLSIKEVSRCDILPMIPSCRRRVWKTMSRSCRSRRSTETDSHSSESTASWTSCGQWKKGTWQKYKTRNYKAPHSYFTRQ